MPATYAEILRAAGAQGPMRGEAKRTCIHLVRKTAFAGALVRTHFRSWSRTTDPSRPLSDLVVAGSLRRKLGEFSMIAAQTRS